MVAQLTARGVKATPSYRVAPDGGPVSQERMQQVANEAGATGVLLTGVVNVSQTVQVTPGMTAPPRCCSSSPRWSRLRWQGTGPDLIRSQGCTARGV
jgi:hypothetical protein